MLDNVNDARAHAAFLRGLSGQSDFAEDRAAFAEIAEFLEHIVAGRLVVRAPRPAAPDDAAPASGAPVEAPPTASPPTPSADEPAPAEIDVAAPPDEVGDASATTAAPAASDVALSQSEPST